MAIFLLLDVARLCDYYARFSYDMVRQGTYDLHVNTSNNASSTQLSLIWIHKLSFVE